MVSNLRTKDKDYSVRYMHFTFTHFPVDFDENCNYRSDDAGWYGSHQNESGIVLQTECALKKMVELSDKLKSLGIYDRSLVVFKSDHGKPSNYYSAYPNSLRINNNRDWGYSRYRPALLVKGFGAVKPQITYVDELVLLNDLAKTLCEASGQSVDCEKFPGINLLNNGLSVDTPYYLYVPKDAESSFSHNDHLSVMVPTRKIPLLQAVKDSQKIEISISD